MWRGCLVRRIFGISEHLVPRPPCADARRRGFPLVGRGRDRTIDRAMVRFFFGSPVGFVAMHLRFKITSVSMRVCVAVVFAIALAVACAAAFAQSPAAGAQSASVAPSASVPTAARPAAAASAAAVSVLAAPLPPDAKTVISYLSNVINWYGHLGVEAQLVSEPDETLFFADDRQVASEVLRLAFEYARAQAAFLAKTSPNGAVAATGSTGTKRPPPRPGWAIPRRPRCRSKPPRLRSARKSRICRRSWRKRRRASASRRTQIQDLQSELDLNQARLDALKALTEFESGSAAPDQNSGLPAQIDDARALDRRQQQEDDCAARDAALVTRSERTGILGFITDLFALSNKLDALEENIALAKALAARADGVRKSILASITSLNERGDALARAEGGADVAALQDRKKSSKNCSKPTSSPARRPCRSASKSCCWAFTSIMCSAGTTRSNSAGTRNSAASSSA